ncbi:MAG: hypothetical protein IBX68_05940 [Dehalococcoidia bacterium]|nr:hypothetical protein [Dehalococcoidia bacterium]
MSKIAAKLFREPEPVKDAINQLKSKGYKAEEIFIVASKNRAKKLDSGIKAVTDLSQMAQIGIPAETAEYYSYAIESGGIVVAVQADESRLAEAQRLLREISICHSDQGKPRAASPGFQFASRMSSTNPIDAPMSGDFRRY